MNRFCKGAAAAMAIGLTSGGCASGADAQIVAGPTGPNHTRDDRTLFIPDPSEINSATMAQIEVVRESVAPYRDVEVAREEGWQPVGMAQPLVGQHWAPPAEMGRSGMARQGLLDFARPNRLIYAQVEGETVLVAAGFAVTLAGQASAPPGFSGEADRWCIARSKDGSQRTALLHVWVALPNPDGPFAWHNRALPLLRQGSDMSSLDAVPAPASSDVCQDRTPPTSK